MSPVASPPPRRTSPPTPGPINFQSRKESNLYPLCIAAIFGFALFLVVIVGGILFPVSNFEKKKKVEVEQELDISNLKKPDTEQPKEEVEQEKEPPPPAPIMENVNIAAPAMDDAPALAPMSLSDLESALAPGGGGGMFGGGGGFQSGRIGGKGGGGLGADMDQAFSMADLDQKPRAVYQPAPVYPAALRSRKIDGVVTVIFVVDANGKVANAKVEKSTDPAFDKPALDAVRKWKFEPAMKEGRKVSAKMRAPIRFDTKASS
jgi:protein TonB